VRVADGSLQKIALQARFRSSGLVTHFLEKRLKLALLQRCDERGIFRLDPEIFDRHRQFQMTIQIDHFSVLQNLLACVGELLAGACAFHLVNVCEQWLQPAKFANQCRRPFAAQSDSGNVVDRITGQGEHVADKLRLNVPFGEARSAFAVV